MRVALAGIIVSLTVSPCPRQCAIGLKPYVQMGKDGTPGQRKSLATYNQ